jgi:hypothetical protein
VSGLPDPNENKIDETRPDQTRKNYTALALQRMHAFHDHENNERWLFSVFITCQQASMSECCSFLIFFIVREGKINVSFLCPSHRNHEEAPKQSRAAMEIDQVIKAAEEIASGRQGPHYMVKVLRSKL